MKGLQGKIGGSPIVLVAVLVCGVLASCGTPGPGMLFDVASKEYKAQETRDLNSKLAQFLAGSERTSKLSGSIIYSQDLMTAYMRKYVIVISGRSATQDDIAYIKSTAPTVLEIDVDKCDFKINVDSVI